VHPASLHQQLDMPAPPLFLGPGLRRKKREGKKVDALQRLCAERDLGGIEVCLLINRKTMIPETESTPCEE